MFDLLVDFAFAWYFAKWIISKETTVGFLIFSFIAVLVATTIVGFIAGWLNALIIGLNTDTLEPAANGAVGGLLAGLSLGSFSLVKEYRSITKSNR